MADTDGVKGFLWYHDYGRKTAKLSDQELGRLLRALTVYSETGETQELAGRESIAYDFIAEDIRRAQDAYKEKCEKNAANAAAGAAARWGANNAERVPIMPNGNERQQTAANDAENAHNKVKEQYKEKEQSISPPIPPTRGDGDGQSAIMAMIDETLLPGLVKEKLHEWLAYKGKSAYKAQGVKALISRTKKAVDEYGGGVVCAVIDDSMANGYKGIIWGNLSKVVSGDPLDDKCGTFDTNDFFNLALKRGETT